MSHNCPVWPATRVERLYELADGTRKAREIAEILGVSRNAVIGKVGRLREQGYPVALVAPCNRKLQPITEREPIRPVPVEKPRPPAVVEKPPTLCASPGCRNTRLKGYPDGMCRDCRMDLMPERKRASVWTGIDTGTVVHMPHGLRY